MPIYEYECRKCHLRFENLQFKPEPWTIQTCPRCSWTSDLVPSAPRLNIEFPHQMGSTNSMSNYIEIGGKK